MEEATRRISSHCFRISLVLVWPNARGPQCSSLFHLARQIQFLGEVVTDTRGKAEAEQGRYLLGSASCIREMLANMQVALMVAQRIDDIEGHFVRSDDLRRSLWAPR